MTDARREIILFLQSGVRERSLAKGFSFNTGDAKTRVCVSAEECHTIVCIFYLEENNSKLETV